ncbi:MAG TPA: mannosyltransferase family protein [Actinomycetota bacterium]|nr:mannosyltransferase family protein [Actinomycetota bacterium]
MTTGHTTAADTHASGDGTIRLRDGLRDAVVVFVGVRLAVFALSAFAGAGLIPMPADQPAFGPAFPPPSLEPGWHVVFTGTQRQDAMWYLGLATDGYATDDASAAFFPLYPSLIRALTWVPGVGPLAAALAISNAALLGSLVVFHALTRHELGDDTEFARRAVRYLAIFPTAFFFLAPYSESLFLLLCLLAFWWARGDRWGHAAAASILAALTRSPGIVLLVALAVEAIDRSRRDGRSPLPRLAAAAATALAPLGWFAWWQVRSGDFWAPLDAQRTWSRDASLPWETIVDAVWHAWRYRTYWLLDVIVVVLAIVGVMLAIRRIRPAYLVFAGSSILLPLLVPFPDRPLLSMPRFVAVVFPVAWGYASAVDRQWVPDALVTGTFTAGYALMAALFVAWLYVF